MLFEERGVRTDDRCFDSRFCVSKGVSWPSSPGKTRNIMSAITVTSGGVNGGGNNNNNNNTGAGAGDPVDGFALFQNRPPIWSTSNPSALDQQWNESIFSPVHHQQQQQQHQQQHRPWPSEPFGSDIGGDELPYPRQTSNHNNDFSPLPTSPAALLNGNHLGHAGRFQFPTDSASPFGPHSLPPMSSCFNDSLYDSPSSLLFPTDLDRRGNSLLDTRQLHQQQQQQQHTLASSLDNPMMSRESKLTLDQMVGRFADLQLQPPPSHQQIPSSYPPYQNSFLPPSNEQQQQMLSSFYYSSSPSNQQIPSSIVNSRLPPPPPFGNHLYLNSPSSGHPQYTMAQQANGSLPPTTSAVFNDLYDRNDGYLPFSNNSSYLSAMRFSPNPAYRTTKSGKQQIGPENANLFICHLPQETNDQSLMNLFSQFGMFVSKAKKNWITFILFSSLGTVLSAKVMSCSIFQFPSLTFFYSLGLCGQENQSIEMFWFCFLR